MEQRVLLSLRLPRDIVEELNQVRVTLGMPVNEQIRRAIVAWLETEGWLKDIDQAKARRRLKPRRGQL